ncbi:MAG: hypothetical protein J6V00_08280 [Bacteroidaceae bacterium]|nr:hypothetical protein [Bacteroidaceae bacterium]
MKRKTKGKLDCKELDKGLRMNEHTLDALVTPGHYKIGACDVTHSEGFPEDVSQGRLSAYLEVTSTNHSCDRLKDNAIGQVLTVTDSDGVTNIYTRNRTNSNGINIWSAWSGVGGKSASDIMDGAITKQKLNTELRNELNNIAELEKKVSQEKKDIINGNTIVGVAREVYSSHGKNDTATFIKRSTAGETTIGNGVATLKQIGGNIVKNLVDGTFANSTSFKYETASGNLHNGILTVTSKNSIYGSVNSNDVTNIYSHIYYPCANVYNCDGDTIRISVDGGLNQNVLYDTHKWSFISHRGSNTYTVKKATIRLMTSDQQSHTMYVKNWLLIDLTEMFGAGKEPTKEECDRIFSTMGALPQGLNFAQAPTEYKSTGFNQINPAKILVEKTVAGGVITDSANTSVAIVECLPCKIGVGENNGYVIGYGQGEEWSDSGVEVYLTPLNPLETDGELYLQKLEKDTTYNSYVPQINGYLLVVTPQTNKLCAHLHWSGDRPATDYEPYIESTILLPKIPQMSEWGLAGISTSGKMVQDFIDLERMKYYKKISYIDLGNITWFRYLDFPNIGLYYGRVQQTNIPKLKMICDKYTSISWNLGGITDNCIMSHYESSLVYIRNDKFVDKSASDFKETLRGVKLFYELAIPEEYTLHTAIAPNYINSDYGIEEFKDGNVPLTANILFYMRSLVSEIRNFLDRLMTGIGSTDATVVADKLLAAIDTE